ncbi:MAG: winged helix-turn-helix domain-containing protein [Acidobacteriota bacterium]
MRHLLSSTSSDAPPRADGERSACRRAVWVGRWLVEPTLNRLSTTEPAVSVTLEPRVMELLMVLAAQPRRVVSKQELLDRVWHDVVVADGALSLAVHKLRKALGESAHAPALIETIPRRGYRLLAPVRSVATVPPELEAAHGGQATTGARYWARLDGSVLQMALGLSAITLVIVALAVSVAFGRADEEPRNGIEAPWTTRPLTAWLGVERYPAVSLDGTRIAFVHRPPRLVSSAAGDPAGEESSTWDLYLGGFDGSAPRRLTADRAVESWPAFSPDGTSVAFVRTTDSGSEIARLVLRTGTVETVTRLDAPSVGLAWEPSGRVIFGRTDAEGRFRLVRHDPATAAESDLTEPPANSYGDGMPTLSADGSRLAFARGTPSQGVDLMLLDLAVGDLRRVAALDQLISGLAWSADGRGLVVGTVGKGDPRLVRWPVDGGAARVLELLDDAVQPAAAAGRLVYVAQTPRQGIRRFALRADAVGTAWCPSTRADARPVFSPSGDRVAFLSRREGGADLWVAAADGSAPRRVSELDASFLLGIAWSPDGREIAFSATLEGYSDLYLARPAERYVRRLTHDRHVETELGWSADGRSIYFSSNRSGRWQVWRLETAGGAPVQVTRGGGFAAHESADGRMLTFAREDGGLWRLPVDGIGFDGSGPAERVAGSESFAWQSLVHRTEVDGAVYFARRSVGEQVELVRFDPADGSSRRIADLGAAGSLECTVSPRLAAALCTDARQTEADLREVLGSS